MADIVTFPCEYLVVHTGYTGRLLDEEKLEALQSFCKDQNVVPLFIYDTVWGSGQIEGLTIGDDTIINEFATEVDRALCQELYQRLERNNLYVSGIIVFKVETFENATKVFSNIGGLDYCYMGGLIDMKFLRGPQGNIDMAFVSFDCESG